MPIKYFTWIVVIIGVQFVKTDNGNDSKITHFTPSRDARLTIVAQTENITKYPFMVRNIFRVIRQELAVLHLHISFGGSWRSL